MYFWASALCCHPVLITQFQSGGPITISSCMGCFIFCYDFITGIGLSICWTRSNYYRGYWYVSPIPKRIAKILLHVLTTTHFPQKWFISFEIKTCSLDSLKNSFEQIWGKTQDIIFIFSFWIFQIFFLKCKCDIEIVVFFKHPKWPKNWFSR